MRGDKCKFAHRKLTEEETAKRDSYPSSSAGSSSDTDKGISPVPRGGPEAGKLCREFARTGKCSRGMHCKFLHVVNASPSVEQDSSSRSESGTSETSINAL